MVSNTDSHSGRVLAAIAAGGALGGPARYGLGLAFPTAPHTFPATTFAINVSGSFLLALLVVLILDVWPPTIYVRPFLCVGFLGAYTTFSTWMVDTDRLISAGAWGAAVANLVLSLVAGLGATALGLSVGRGIAAARHGSRDVGSAASDADAEPNTGPAEPNTEPGTESGTEPGTESDAESETIGGRR
ncbi:CrcB family protein [Catenulispora sp. NL8]|uniref:Fluoride-specific ion channel FluC n=1 Tax=Catenulispora pinistramenti TaxID=2705254 RepID=A0ABS5KSL0_9ACTN|nr:CrcB family protein [Catenulispora pinistramenti]MBS2549032.1 CrcB family protein [Catenulispora pinistramenti]